MLELLLLEPPSPELELELLPLPLEVSSPELEELLLELDSLEPVVVEDVIGAAVVLVVSSALSPEDESGNTNPVVGASVSMKNGLSSMHAGRRNRNVQTIRFI